MSQSFVYFIKPVGLDGPIKIGCSGNVTSRLATLMSWSPFPLEVVATIPGSFDLEQNIQDCFLDCLRHGEWFNAEPRLVDAIAKIADGVPVENAIDLSDRRGNIRRGKHKGAAAWSAQTKQYMRVFHRLRHASAKIGRGNYSPPPPLDAILDASRVRALTEDEWGTISAYVADPYSFLTHPERVSA